MVVGIWRKNDAGEKFLELAESYDLTIVNTIFFFFFKEEHNIITYESGGYRSQICFLLV